MLPGFDAPRLPPLSEFKPQHLRSAKARLRSACRSRETERDEEIRRLRPSRPAAALRAQSTLDSTVSGRGNRGHRAARLWFVWAFVCAFVGARFALLRVHQYEVGDVARRE